MSEKEIEVSDILSNMDKVGGHLLKEKVTEGLEELKNNEEQQWVELKLGEPLLNKILKSLTKAERADKLEDESYNAHLERWLAFREQQKNLYHEAINEISYAVDKTNTPSEHRERDLAEEITHILKGLDDKELVLVINELEKREESEKW